MLTLMDWMVQLERSRALLTHSGHARLAQLACSKPAPRLTAKTLARKLLDRFVTLPPRCCPEAMG